MPTWVELSPSGDIPGPSSTHSVCVHEGKMYKFGGYDGKFRRGYLHSFEIGTLGIIAMGSVCRLGRLELNEVVVYLREHHNGWHRVRLAQGGGARQGARPSVHAHGGGDWLQDGRVRRQHRLPEGRRDRPGLWYVSALRVLPARRTLTVLDCFQPAMSPRGVLPSATRRRLRASGTAWSPLTGPRSCSEATRRPETTTGCSDWRSSESKGGLKHSTATGANSVP